VIVSGPPTLTTPALGSLLGSATAAPQHVLIPTTYTWLMVLGMAVGVAYSWWRVKRGGDSRLVWLAFAALVGCAAGAKLSFVIAEGWHYRTNMLGLLSGKSILGGLLGGYAAVEFVKRAMRDARPSGDHFAVVVPIGLTLGRVGCLTQGCCRGMVCEKAHWFTREVVVGVPRVAAAEIEVVFHAVACAAAVFTQMLMARTESRWARTLRGNLFHVYLMAYGVLRLILESGRENSRWFGAVTGYHFMAAAVLLLGLVGFVMRARRNTASAL